MLQKRSIQKNPDFPQLSEKMSGMMKLLFIPQSVLEILDPHMVMVYVGFTFIGWIPVSENFRILLTL